MEKEKITAKLLAMKISNWDSIPYSVALQCPNGDDGDFADGNRTLVGWCDTPGGLMKVYECPFCHQRHRFHGVMQERWNLRSFLANLYRERKLSDRLKERRSKNEGELYEPK